MNLVFGGFLIFNILGNLFSIILIDSSAFSSDEMMTAERFKTDPTARDWNLCEKCEIIVPPRSWHCDICTVCILKRDHHCMFSGNCVGYTNHRQFIMFLFYFFIGTTYAFCYNSYFVWILNGQTYLKLMTIVKMALPMFMIMYGSLTELHICCYMLILIGSALSGVLLIYHGKHVLHNTTTHEKNKGTYDMGTKMNLRLVFGDNWLLGIFWPFASNKLPKIYWDLGETSKGK